MTLKEVVANSKGPDGPTAAFILSCRHSCWFIASYCNLVFLYYRLISPIIPTAGFDDTL